MTTKKRKMQSLVFLVPAWWPWKALKCKGYNLDATYFQTTRLACWLCPTLLMSGGIPLWDHSGLFGEGSDFVLLLGIKRRALKPSQTLSSFSFLLLRDRFWLNCPVRP